MIDPKYRIGNVATQKPREALEAGDAVYVCGREAGDLYGCNGVIHHFADARTAYVKALTLDGRVWAQGDVPLSCLEHQTHPDIVAAVAAYHAPA